MSETQTRSAYWDNVKGILIILVVFAHILYQLQDSSNVIDKTVDLIYMFHMPAFVFVSGYMGKKEHAHSFESIVKLAFLYFVFNSIMWFIYGFSSLLVPMYSYWYLIALIVWRLTAHRIAKIKEIKLILFAVAIFAGFYTSIDNTFAIARIICFYPYYMMGYSLSSEKSDSVESKSYGKRVAVGIGLIVLFLPAALMTFNIFLYNDSDFQMYGYDGAIKAFGRVVLYLFAFLMIYALRLISPSGKIRLITMLGRNSLWIFLFHRPITLFMSKYMNAMTDPEMILTAMAGTAIICIIFGNEKLAKYLDRFAKGSADIFTNNTNKRYSAAQIVLLGVALCYIANIVMTAYKGVELEDMEKLLKGEYSESAKLENSGESDVICRVMSDEQKKKYDDAFRITFAGDLILLEDQVKLGYRDNGYNYDDIFEYAKPYISSADFAIGVFEGPMAGDMTGYTTGNYGDGKNQRLNYPDEYAVAVKNAGFDLVTTANNHLLDKGESGALRTIDVLDEIGLDHTGTYKNGKDKTENNVKIVECRGIRMAILSYTYGCNYGNPDELFNGDLSYITSFISGTEGVLFEKLKSDVEKDFNRAKELNPDIIIVLPHIGTQFSNDPDEEQKVWFDIFKENGADVILGDHAHVVQPIIMEEYDGRKVFSAYSPGNFANCYREDQGDTSMLIDIYIDRNKKEIIGGSVIPLYTYANIDSNFKAVPIYDIIHNDDIKKQLTTDDMVRAESADKVVKSVVFGTETDNISVKQRYYFDEKGFVRDKTKGLNITDDMKEGAFYSELEKADSVCFIGDSVTEGTKNGGCPWYEPMEEYLAGKEILNYSKGGATVPYISEHADEIPSADLYVVALGANDIRYHDAGACAMTADDYVKEIDSLRSKIIADNDKRFVFISPWLSLEVDPFCNISYDDKLILYAEYSEALKEYCIKNGYVYIDANAYILDAFKKEPERKYLLDHIHPNSEEGVILYSEAVLSDE